MRQRITGLLFTLAAAPLAAQVQNGDFEQAPPAIPGWREIGSVPAGSTGSQGTPNAARLGPTTGVSLRSGADRATAIWQRFTHGIAAFPCAIEFDYRVAPGACAYVEVNGPAGIHGAFLPANFAYTTWHIEYPVCGDLELSFNVIESGVATVTQLFQVDQVLATPTGDVPAGTRLPLQPLWVPSPGTTAKEQAIVELRQLRDTFGKRFTSPKGLVSTEGNGKHGFMLFSRPTVTWQQVDSSHAGTAGFANLRALSLRRDRETPGNPEFVARQVEVEIVMAHSDVQRMAPEFAPNYLDTPVTVFVKKTVSLPGWETQPIGVTPAPWDVRLPFDVQWSYDGVNDLLFEIRVTANSGAPYPSFENYPIDAEDLTGSFVPATSPGVSLFGGCATVGQMAGPFALASNFSNHRFKFSMDHAVTGAPASTAVAVALALDGATSPVGLLCAPTFLTPVLNFPLGTADPNGTIASVTFPRFPYASSFVGTDLYFQAFAFDFTQVSFPISFSDGVKITVPQDPVFPATGYIYHYANSAGGTLFKSGPWPGGIVALFDY